MAQGNYPGGDISAAMVGDPDPDVNGYHVEAGTQESSSDGAGASSDADCQSTDVAIRVLTGILGNVNAAGRSNIAIARNIGGHGSVQSASATQTYTVRQADGQTQEESETTTITCNETGR